VFATAAPVLVVAVKDIQGLGCVVVVSGGRDSTAAVSADFAFLCRCADITVAVAMDCEQGVASPG